MRDIFAARFTDLAPLVLRLAAGFHLIHGTQDNVFSWSRMMEFRDFLAAHGFPLPLVCAVVSVACQFAAGLLFLVGYRTRWAAFVMVLNFLVAIFGVHVAQGHSYGATFPAIMMLTLASALWFGGAGRWSLDARTEAAGAPAARG